MYTIDDRLKMLREFDNQIYEVRDMLKKFEEGRLGDGTFRQKMIRSLSEGLELLNKRRSEFAKDGY
jgi:tryptophanyl-tRNA synthetase